MDVGAFFFVARARHPGLGSPLSDSICKECVHVGGWLDHDDLAVGGARQTF